MTGTPPIVFVGAATFDAIALVDHMPAADQRVIANEVMFAGGGPAATAAVAAARLGAQVAFVGVVGTDDDGDRIIAGLDDEGVDTSGVLRISGRPSGASIVIVDRSQGSRAICTRPVPNLILDSYRQVELIEAAEWVHVDHLGWDPTRRLLEASEAKPRISVDAGNPISGFSPDGVSLYVPTIEALQRQHGNLDTTSLLLAALHEGAVTVVATRGSKGSVAMSGERDVLEAPGVQVPLVSTLGAGDVFHGALLAAVVHGDGLLDCLTFANTVAAMSCMALDGRSAIPTRDSARAYLASATSQKI